MIKFIVIFELHFVKEKLQWYDVWFDFFLLKINIVMNVSSILGWVKSFANIFCKVKHDSVAPDTFAEVMKLIKMCFLPD